METNMNIAEIKTAVDAGRSVHWSNEGYVVRKDTLGQYLIIFEPNSSYASRRSSGSSKLSFMKAHNFAGITK